MQQPRRESPDSTNRENALETSGQTLQGAFGYFGNTS
jgi:hypothetical protein